MSLPDILAGNYTYILLDAPAEDDCEKGEGRGLEESGGTGLSRRLERLSWSWRWLREMEERRGGGSRTFTLFFLTTNILTNLFTIPLLSTLPPSYSTTLYTPYLYLTTTLYTLSLLLISLHALLPLLTTTSLHRLTTTLTTLPRLLTLDVLLTSSFRLLTLLAAVPHLLVLCPNPIYGTGDGFGQWEAAEGAVQGCEQLVGGMVLGVGIVLGVVGVVGLWGAGEVGAWVERLEESGGDDEGRRGREGEDLHDIKSAGREEKDITDAT